MLGQFSHTFSVQILFIVHTHSSSSLEAKIQNSWSEIDSKKAILQIWKFVFFLPKNQKSIKKKHPEIAFQTLFFKNFPARGTLTHGHDGTKSRSDLVPLARQKHTTFLPPSLLRHKTIVKPAEYLCVAFKKAFTFLFPFMWMDGELMPQQFFLFTF